LQSFRTPSKTVRKLRWRRIRLLTPDCMSQRSF